MMIGCLKWVLPLLQQNIIPGHPERHSFGSIELEKAAILLSSWRTPRLEAVFCQMATRAVAGDAVGLSMLRGLPAPMELRNAALEQRPVDPYKVSEEQRQTARMLGQRIQTNTWYDRAYRLKFFPAPQPQEQRHRAAAATAGQERDLGRGGLHPNLQAAGAGSGLGRRNEAALWNRPYVLDEVAMQSDLMTPEAASRVAIIHGFAVSREGRLSCPVQSGALIAGLLPQDWPRGALEATGAAAPLHPDGTHPMSSYDAMMRAVLDQPSVISLNDKLDAESVFAACASGQLPPWVRHVVMDHAEYIELLPLHLIEAVVVRGHSSEIGSAADGVSGEISCGAQAAACSSTPRNGGLPAFHPVLWFRFTDHSEYSRRRLPRPTVALLGQIAKLFRDAADLLAPAADELLDVLRMEAKVWVKALLCNRDASAVPSPAGLRDAGAAQAPDGVGTSTGFSAAGVGRELGSSSSASIPVPGRRISIPLVSRQSPQPESFKLALHRAIRLVDGLNSLGTAAYALTQEVHEVGGLPPLDSEVLDLLQQASAMRASLVSVGRQLAPLEGPSWGAHMHEVLTLRRVNEEEGGLEEEGLEQEEEDNEEEAEDETVEDSNEDSEVEVGSRHRSDSSSMRTTSGLATGLGSAEARAGEGELRPAAERGSGRDCCLKETISLEGTRLKDALECGVLGPEGRQARLALAAALRQQVAAAEAAMLVQNSRPNTVERRNEELLQRLPVAVAPLSQPPAGATAAASPPGRNDGLSDNGLNGGVVLEPPAPAGWAAERLFDPELQHDVDSGRVVSPEANVDGHRVVHMAGRLLFPVAANAVVFKAIRPENLVEMVGWDDNEQPNVDVQYVALQGRVVRLPPGVQAGV
ncbi:hypothetical protein Vretimale_3525 [Volvox reticuliferus]|uniref:Uncharacterized protein n=2 Tax=Volvox reticuliferus TaxID=1737510 RepID=A0A8J4FGS6_9CHLO|nr:hypothetical protein Vretifemale_1087 [Volvox reticuliferus]GIL97978.1 hypothetical protein Vretimale_3525 [Volvox reticuliferus]